MIRAAVPEDAKMVREIYRPFVESTFITFETELPSVEEMRARIGAYQQRHEFLVFEDGGPVLGYAYGTEHRARAAYQWCAEISVYVSRKSQGRGIGGELYRALIDRLFERGYVNLYAGIALPNDKSLALHEKLGFEKLAHYREVGFKLGAWRDVGWWGLRNPKFANPATEPAPL